MTKKNSLLIVALAIGVTMAQAQSTSTTIAYKKNMEPALVIYLPAATTTVEAVIFRKLKQAGYEPDTNGLLFWKTNKKDGFYSFYDVSFPTLFPHKLNMFFKILQTGSKANTGSTVFLLVSTGNGYFSSPEQHSDVWTWSQTFMNNLPDWVASHTLEADITQQSIALTDTRKKMANLREDEQELTGKIKRYQESLVDNRRGQVSLEKDINSKVKAIEFLQSQRMDIDASEFRRIAPSISFDQTPAVKIAYPYPG